MSFTPKNAVVWTEIPVTDLDAGKAFYSKVTGMTLMDKEMGPDKTAIFMCKDYDAGVAGHLYEGKPAGDGTGPTLHLSIDGKLDDALSRVSDAGGQVVSEIISIEHGRFCYIKDLDGNSVSLFEAKT